MPNNIRKIALSMIYEAQSGHIGASFSLAEVIAYLFLKRGYRPQGKDKLILSKGHAAPILYAALIASEEIDKDEMSYFREHQSILQGHPDSGRCNKIDATTGSLGQGLSIAIGHSLANKLLGIKSKIYCILGDGELQEGQVWEALMFIGKHNLSDIVTIIDCNKFQNDGPTMYDITQLPSLNPNLFYKGTVLDGNNYGLVCRDLDYIIDNAETLNLPPVILLNTVKAAGVSFMAGKAEWHGKIPNEQEYTLAMEELA